jgi:hypothetical protein
MKWIFGDDGEILLDVDDDWLMHRMHGHHCELAKIRH